MAINKRKILQSAQKHLQKGALDRALKDYRTLLEADPKDCNIRLKVGDIFLRQGKSEDAVAHYLKVAEKFMADGFDAKAVALYKQVTKIDPKRYDVLTPLSDLYHRMGLTSDALKALQTAADALYREGNKPAALDVLRKMATLDPANTINRLKVAELLRQEGMASDALAEYRECAAELERQGEVEGRINVIEKILELAPDSGQDLLDLGRACLGVRKWTRAEEVGDRLSRTAPGFEVEACEIVAEAYKGLRRDDALPDVYRRMAEALRSRGDDDAAREIQQRFSLHEGLSADEPPALETDDDLLDDMLDLGGSEADLELDEPVPLQPAAAPMAPAAAAVPVQPAAAAVPAELPEGDPEQLMAEASVYLRYGKRDRAIACLQAVQQQSRDCELLTRVAESFEGCGEAQAAVGAFCAAAQVARSEGADETFKRLHSRIAALDAQAAAELSQSAPAPEVAADSLPGFDADDFSDDGLADFVGDDPTESSDDSSAGIAEEQSSGLGEEQISVLEEEQGSGSGAAGIEFDIDVASGAGEVSSPAGDFDFGEVDASLTDPGSALDPDGVEVELPLVDDTAPGAAAAPAAEGNELEFSFDEDIVTSEAEPAVLPDESSPDVVVSVAPEATAPSAADLEIDTSEFDTDDEAVPAPAADDASGGAADRIRESLEEAAFYLQQGLFDEAQTVCQQVLELAPNQPQALLRLGEIEAARNADAAAPAAAAEPVAAPSVETPVVPEPPFVPEAPVVVPELAELGGLEVTAPVEVPAHEADESGDFDLAKELSGAFHEDDASATGGSETEAEGFEEVFAAFKKGVEQELGDDDFEARYDLGIAYREMGLLDDAVGEFRAALKGPKRKLDCLHMMGVCALDLGNGQDAVGNLEQALALPDVPEEQQMALRFDLGRAYRLAGEIVRAKECFEAVAALDPDFCDVGECLEALERGEAAPAPDDEDGFESFEDLVMDDDDDDDETAPAADTTPAAESAEVAAAEEVEEEESYESFGDLMDENDAEDADVEDEPEPAQELAEEAGDVDGIDESAEAEILEAALIPEDEEEVDFVGSEDEFPAADEAPAEPESPKAEKAAAAKKSKKKRKKISFV